MAMSNAERQRKHKEKLKTQAADSTSIAEQLAGSTRTLEGLVARFERAMELAATMDLPEDGAMPPAPAPAGALVLPPDEVESLARIKQLRYFREDGSYGPEVATCKFLGMSIDEWLMARQELLAVFGLVDTIAKWNRQINEGIAANRLRQPEDRESHAPEPAEAVDFATLEKAYWSWLNKECPFPARSDERRLWVRQNQLSYDGTVWTRISDPLPSGTGKPFSNWQVTFTGDDGRVIEQPIEETAQTEPRRARTSSWGS